MKILNQYQAMSVPAHSLHCSNIRIQSINVYCIAHYTVDRSAESITLHCIDANCYAFVLKLAVRSVHRRCTDGAGWCNALVGALLEVTPLVNWQPCPCFASI